MNAPSFSSFPASFDLLQEVKQEGEKASHNKPHQSKDRGRDRDRHKKHRLDTDGQKKRRDSGRPKDEKIKHSQRDDDEQAKREEDRHARLGTNYDGLGGALGLFVIDKVGDPMNVVYDGLHVSDIPKYRRVGFGNVLGLGKAFKIVSRGTGGKSIELGINGKRLSPRYIDPRSFAILTTIRTRHLTTASSDHKGKGKLDVESPAEYIRLPSRGGQPSNEPLSTYRSINFSRDDHVNSDSEASSFTPSDNDASSSESVAGGDSAPRSAHQHSLTALEAALQKDPTSLQTWLALLNQTLSTVPPSAKSSLARARAEIKLSVLDRAMRSHKQNEASVELRIKWLNAGAEVWDPQKLQTEWEQAVRELGGQRPNDQGEKYAKNRVWEEWLGWRVSSAGKGSRRRAGVEGIVEDATRVLENIEGEMGMVKILWRTALILKEAGFSERAMALFQAQAELTFNCVPTLAPKPFAACIDSLEEFWDAEHPRVGEPGAQGWAAWEQAGKPQLQPPLLSSPQSTSNMDLDMTADPYIRWAVDEARSDTNSTMPRHSDHSGEDPYAIILFSDVRPLLVNLVTTRAKHAFRLAWLEFLGLHVPGLATSLCENTTTAGRDDVWSHRHLSRMFNLRQLFPPQHKGKEREWDAYVGTIIAREKNYGPTFGCVKEWGLGVFDLLEGIGCAEGRLWDKINTNGTDRVLVRRIFEQLRRKLAAPGEEQDEEWDVMAIAFEAATNIKSALKLSRTIISTARNSLPLWGAHARLERMRGRLDEARRIYETALCTTHVSAPCSLRRSEAILWWAWAEMEWLAGDDHRSRAVVLRATSADPATGGAMAVLRAKRTLEDRMRSWENLERWKERESWACLRALLEVLMGGTGALEAGMEVLENYIGELGLEGVPRESAWTHMLLLGWKHATILGRQIKRTAMREKVVRVVKDLGDSRGGLNTAILGVFLESEKGESVWGRVRALVGEGTSVIGKEKGLFPKSNEKDITRRVWEVWLATWERGRWEAEKERVRSSLGIGVEEERTRASAILWRIYVEFEIYCGELKRAKGLLFRAVSECPLVKELYLLAFGPLRSVFTARELEGWGETLAERGIRMHRDLNEYTGGGGLEAKSVRASDSEGEDEIEKEARDYRRLAPF